MNNANTTDTDLLSINDASRAARVCRRKFYHLLNSGDIRGLKLGRRTFVRRSEINRFLTELPAYPASAAA